MLTCIDDGHEYIGICTTVSLHLREFYPKNSNSNIGFLIHISSEALLKSARLTAK